MQLSDFVVSDAVTADLSAIDRDAVIAELIDALVAAGAAPAEIRDDLIKKVLARETNGSTGFGKGVAVPHVKHEQLTKMAAAVGVSKAGIDFHALDRQPVYSVFLLLSPQNKPDEHLQAMEIVFSHLQRDLFRRFLKQANSQQEVLDLLAEADAQKLR